MRDRITIETNGNRQDAYGEHVQSWQPIKQVWAQIKTLSGRQLSLAQASTKTSTSTHQITVRYTPDISLRNRLSITNSNGHKRTFEINSIDDVDNRHVEMVCTATEVQL